MPDEVVKLLVDGALGSVSAVAAHRNVAIYHDGLRTSVADITSGLKSRREMASDAYTISIGFVVAFALPFALASGILVIHMIMLGTDTIGVWSRHSAESLAGGFAWGLLDQLGGFGPEVRSLVLDHHERPDGRSYPRGLAGDELPLDARVLAVCDVFDALVSERPYREAWPVERALATLAEGAETQFDARCVQALTDVVRSVASLSEAA